MILSLLQHWDVTIFRAVIEKICLYIRYWKHCVQVLFFEIYHRIRRRHYSDIPDTSFTKWGTFSRKHFDIKNDEIIGNYALPASVKRKNVNPGKLGKSRVSTVVSGKAKYG